MERDIRAPEDHENEYLLAEVVSLRTQLRETERHLQNLGEELHRYCVYTYSMFKHLHESSMCIYYVYLNYILCILILIQSLRRIVAKSVGNVHICFSCSLSTNERSKSNLSIDGGELGALTMEDLIDPSEFHNSSAHSAVNRMSWCNGDSPRNLQKKVIIYKLQNINLYFLAFMFSLHIFLVSFKLCAVKPESQ